MNQSLLPDSQLDKDEINLVEVSRRAIGETQRATQVGASNSLTRRDSRKWYNHTTQGMQTDYTTCTFRDPEEFRKSSRSDLAQTLPAADKLTDSERRPHTMNPSAP